MDGEKPDGGRAITDKPQELDEILNAVTNFTYDAMAHRGDPLVGTLPTMDKATAKLAIIDWHNKQLAKARLNEVQSAYEYWINGREFIPSYFRDRIAELSSSKEEEL